jgi:hypothetical protein
MITVSAYGNVNISATRSNPSAAKYFPRRISMSVIGMVKSSSIVPLRFSSLMSLMVIAGMKKMNMNGIMENIILRDDWFIINSWLVKNHPVIMRNTDITIYATGEKKYAKSPSRKMGTIRFISVHLLRFA